MHSEEDLRKCLSYSCKLLLKRVIAVSPAFDSQIAYKNAIQFGNTVRQVRKNPEDCALIKLQLQFCKTSTIATLSE